MDKVLKKENFEASVRNGDPKVKRLSKNYVQSSHIRYRYAGLFDVWFGGKTILIQRHCNSRPYRFKASEFTIFILEALEEKFQSGLDKDQDLMNIKDSINIIG